MTSWAAFKERLTNVFGRPAVRKLCAEQHLRVQARQTGEDFMSYIEDVVDLCKCVDLAMLETEKVSTMKHFRCYFQRIHELLATSSISVKVTKSCASKGP